jgi:hypothetical protein
MWHDGAFWFETGKASRKGRNVARDPRCTLTLALREFDLVVDGEAHVVTDPATPSPTSPGCGPRTGRAQSTRAVRR